MQPDYIWNVVTNPAWRPFTNTDAPGYLILAACAAVLVGLTFWTYLGAPQTTPRRLTILVALRLVALLIAILSALRPAISEIEQPKLPSTLILVVDASESMSLNDEYDKLSRWEVARRAMDKAMPILQQLESEQQVTVYTYVFAANFNPDADKYDPARKPDGKRTDFGTMLHNLYQRHQSDKNLRGLIIVSDGADNGTDYPALSKAMEWRAINCPIYTFGVGRTDTRSNQKDIAFTSISPDPSPVTVKGDLTIKAMLNAQGLEGANVGVRLLVNDQPVKTEYFRLLKATGNEIAIKTKAPDTPGEIKITLDLEQAPPDDVNPDNNHIESYVTVLKEGVRVLVIDRQRLELKYLRYALGSDKRFDLVQMVRQTDADDGKSFKIEDGAFDAIIIGDVSPKRLVAVQPDIMQQISKLVTKKGVGLLMTGGIDSFGGTPGVKDSPGWGDTPIGDLLPVTVNSAPQIDNKVTKMKPTDKGLKAYIMRLDPDNKINEEIWARLNDNPRTCLGGFTLLGKPKPGATVYANAIIAETGAEFPLLVGKDVGAGRVLAFGGDQTWKWVNFGVGEEAEAKKLKPEEGVNLHARFWKQMALWLAHQETTTGNIYVLPELRRLAVNAKNTIRMGVKDKHGDEIANAELKYQIVPPGQEPDQAKAKIAGRDAKGAYVTYEVKQPGEHRVFVWGKGKDPDGTAIEGDKSAPFIVYPDISDELLRPSANHDFLLGLENTANGFAPETVRRADKLPTFLQEEMLAKPLRLTTAKAKLRPDWSRNGSKWFLPAVLILFVTVLGFEWGLRRVWGMV
jgi:uncharacterized membrane protein